MKLGIYEKAINKNFSWDTKLKLAKEAGFDFIEFSVDESDEKLQRLDWTETKIIEIKHLLEKHNIYFNSLALSGLRRFPLGSHKKEIRDKSIEITKKAIILAKKLGIRIIQLAGYDVYYEKSDQETKKWFLSNLRKITKIAEENSVMISFEIMDTEFMGTITKCLKYINQIDSPYLNIYPDIGNLYQWTKNFDDEIRKGKSQIVAFHFKDTKPGVFKNVPWGKGTVDFKMCMESLENINFQGPIVIEMWSKNEVEEEYKEALNKLLFSKNFFEKFGR